MADDRWDPAVGRFVGGEPNDAESAGVDVDEPAAEVVRARRRLSPRVAAAALVLAAVGATSAAWISNDDPAPDVKLSAKEDRDVSANVATVELAEPSTSTTVTSETTVTSAAAASGTRSSGSRTTSPPTTGAAAVGAPSWEIFLSDVSASPATVSPGQTISFTWRLVSEIGIAQTFVYLSWPEGSTFPAPSNECPHFRVVPPASGNDRDGVYRVACRIPEDTQPATYRVNIMARHHQHGSGDAKYFYDRAHFTVAGPPPTTTSTSTSTTSTTPAP